MDQVIADIFDFEADNSGHISFDNFMRINKNNSKDNKKLREKIHDILEMIKYADERNPASFETYLDTKIINRRIDKNQLLSRKNVNAVVEEGKHISRYVNIMTLNKKNKKLWKRVRT